MKLSSLHIERFGARSNLQLEHLSDRLNLVYGPNGSGKTTIINFIRWMLFGNQDDLSRRYLTPTEGAMGGEIRVIDGHQRRLTITRQNEHRHADQVRVVGDDRELSPAWGLDPHRLTGVTLHEYRHIFCFGFDQPPALDQLIQASQVREIDLAHDEQQLLRIRELTERLDGLRRTYHGYPSDESFPGLLERRRQVQLEMDQLERRRVDRLRQIQVEAESLTQEVQEQRRHIAELEAVLRRTEGNIEVRRRQLDEAARTALQTRDRWQEERRQEVVELDYQIQHWHQVLDAIRQRQERLQGVRFRGEPPVTLPAGADEAELRVFLRSLGYQIDDIDQDLRDLDFTEGELDERVRAEYLRSVFSSALVAMRDDVQRVLRELHRQQQQARHQGEARELDHLRRCETELTSLIDLLNERRQSLLTSPEYAEGEWLSDARSASSLAYESSSLTPRSWHDPRGSQTSFTGALSGVAYGSYRGLTADPVLEARLAHLLKRRDYLAARLRELENELLATERRLELLQGNRAFLEEERQLEALRRELESIDQRMRHAEERQRRRDEIESLERQLDELRRTLGPGDVLREATQILHRLTDGAYRGLRVNDRREIWVEDHRGQRVPDGELSRGTRDQVYLSIALALVSAYRRRGIELPMVLNDVFINIDSERAQATAEVLARFAAQGHQLLVFTRHEHIMQRFGQLQAKLYTLRERSAITELPRREPTLRSEAYYLDHAPVVPVAPLWEPPPAPRMPVAEPSETVRRERSYDWVAEWDTPRRPVVSRPAAEVSTENGAEPVTEHTRLTDLEVLPRPHALRLRDLGIHTVLQLLEMEPEDGERHLATSGVTAAQLFRWQSELSLQCYVGLTANDAALLVACGVDDPEELSYIDVTELHRRIEQLLSQSEARHRFGSIARFERSRLSRWIQTARRSHYRRPRQRWARYRNGQARPTVVPRPEPAPRAEVATERLISRPRRIEPRGPESRGAELRTAEPMRRIESPDDDAARTRRTPARERQPLSAAKLAEITPAQRPESLRFYLEPADPIVDAPSIGPKTAERFHAIDVTTIAQFLELDPTEAARQINYRRLTAEMIRAWQIQTRLVCRVPNLRGHDAQILEGCNIPSAEHLAKMDPQVLYAEVARFVESNEGKRILRGAKAPDQQEVATWIRWAQKAR